MTARGLISLVSLIFCSVPCDRLSWLPVSFYRAMLCAARTMAVARCLSVHPTVCPSVTRHYCAETAKHIIKLFQSHHSRFSLPNVMAIFQQIPSPGRGRRMQMKNRDFLTDISLHLENDTRQGHSNYGMRIVPKLSSGTIFNDLDDHNRDFKVTPLFEAEYLRNGTRYIVTMKYMY